MKLLNWIAVGLSAFALWGCVDSVPRTSSITGNVLDLDGLPVRDATVRAGGLTTQTSSNGAYSFNSLPNGQVEVVAEVFRNGQQFRGRTNVLNFENDKNSSVSIVVVPTNQSATLTGIVRDRDGFMLEGASVFVFNGAGASHRAFTNLNGRFTIRDLAAGFTYAVSASGQGFRSDQTTFQLNTNETRNLDFVLDSPGLPTLSPPQNIGVTSLVSHPDATRAVGNNEAIENVMRLFDGKDRQFISRSRDVRTDINVEVELFWDEQIFPDQFGYGIYRAPSAGGALTGVDFYFEPLAPYYVDGGLNPFSTYSYALTTISTLFPDFQNQTESSLSSRIVVDTLGLLNINDVPFTGPITFSWQGGSGADNYVVFVFDEFPSIGVNSLWNNANNRTIGLSQVYNGPSLQSGRTYYYLVLGLANGDESRTISQIGTFIR